MSYTDPVHFPCITRLWVEVETLLVCCTAEVSDHVWFGMSHRGCVPTLPAQVSRRDDWIMNQLDPDWLFPFITRLWVQVETLLVCFTAEVSDHVSFDHFHLGLVPTLPAYVVLWIAGGTLCRVLWRFQRAHQLSDARTHPCTKCTTGLRCVIGACVRFVNGGFLTIQHPSDDRVRVRGGRLRFEPLVCICRPLRSVLAHCMQPLSESLGFLGLHLR